MSPHLQDLVLRYPCLSSCVGDIELAFSALRTGYATDGKALLCGNGGSASDCQHWAAEMLKSFQRQRPLDSFWRAKLSPVLGAKLQGALPTIPLTAFTSLHTAFANDVDADYAFAQLVWALGKPADILVGISTSGNAANVLAAVEAARALDLVTVGLTGEEGGQLYQAVDICIRVPASRVDLVQELHLPVYHCLALMLEDEFFA
jgi:D-sedoheptulose 7-phosphate isomerase